MTIIRYLTHPQVVVDPATSIECWALNDIGWARARGLLDDPFVRAVPRIVTSAERKALDVAELVAAARGLSVEVRPALGEMDRSATGFLAPDEFGDVVAEFFARPDRSVRGWERAIDAQRRTVDALDDLLDDACDTLVVGHGGVGTLWWCALAGEPIAQRWDQPGQGHWFDVDAGSRRPVGHWQPI